MKLAKDIMSKGVITVDETTKLEDVVSILDEKGFSGLPVVDSDKKLVGLISRTDLSAHALSKNGDKNIQISELMTPFVFNLDPDDSVKKIVDTMLKARIHRVIITDSGEPVGIITSMDLMAEYAKTLNS
jgi:tRNA nucleotidyltransferase (CCA-adding enzyme)